MKKMEDFHHLDLKTDVLLRADVYGEYKNICLEYYGFDPCDHLSNPRLNWDARSYFRY